MHAIPRTILKGVAWVGGIATALWLLFVGVMLYPGLTPTQTADILLKDRKFGSRALVIAPLWGDRLLVRLRERSNDFSRLNGRNSIWVAQVLADRSSASSTQLSRELFERDSVLPSMVGAVGLAARGLLPVTEFRPGGRVSAILNDPRLFEPRTDSTGPDLVEPGSVELAIHATKHARSKDSVEDLGRLLSAARDYWTHAYICSALGEIGGPRSVELLRGALRDSSFHALPQAFRALMTLGDSLAIPLAIERVSPELQGYNSGFLVEELEDATGQRFGYDRDAWRRWWHSRPVKRTADQAR